MDVDRVHHSQNCTSSNANDTAVATLHHDIEDLYLSDEKRQEELEMENKRKLTARTVEFTIFETGNVTPTTVNTTTQTSLGNTNTNASAPVCTGNISTSDTLKLIANDQGDIALNREPRTINEYSMLMYFLCNDCSVRFLSDPTWSSHKRNSPELLRLCDTHVSNIDNNTTAKNTLELLRTYYKFILTHHNRLIERQMTTNHAAVVFAPDSTSSDVTRCHSLMPLGCGREHALILATRSEKESRNFELFAACLTESQLVTVHNLAGRHGASAVTPEMLLANCRPRYERVQNFQLRNVVILRCKVFEYTATVAYKFYERDDLFLCVQQLDGYQECLFNNRISGIKYSDKWLVASNGKFVLVAYSGMELLPTAVHAYYIANKNLHKITSLCFPQHIQKSPNQLESPPVNTSKRAAVLDMTFDVIHTDRAVILLDDCTVVSFMCTAKNDPNSTVVQYTDSFTKTVTTSITCCFVVPTPERQLEIAEFNPRSAKYDAREPMLCVTTAYGNETRLITFSKNNFFIKTLMAHGLPPTIKQHLDMTNGLEIGTLPVLFQHGAGSCVSIATAGNIALVHYIRDNLIIMIDLRTHAPIHVNNGSEYLGFNRAEEATRSYPLLNPDQVTDPFQVIHTYQSCWASLGRLCVQMSDGSLLFYEPNVPPPLPPPPPPI